MAQESAADELIRKVGTAVSEFEQMRRAFRNLSYKEVVTEALDQKRAFVDELDEIQARYKAQLEMLNREIEKQEVAALEFEKKVHEKFLADRKTLEAARANTLSAELIDARQEMARIQSELQQKSREAVERGKVPGASDKTADHALLLALYSSFGVSLEQSIPVERRWKAIQQMIS